MAGAQGHASWARRCRPAVTDASGQYSFASVPEGTYEVRAEAGRCLRGAGQDPAGRRRRDAGLRPARAAGRLRLQAAAASPSSFIDAETVLPLVGDLVSISIPLPFPFTLYGQTYETATVTPKGYIELSRQPGQLHQRRRSPTRSRPTPPSTPSGTTWWSTPPPACGPRWWAARPTASSSSSGGTCSSSSSPTCASRFEMILSETGQILFQYAGPTDDPRQQGNSATIGIENDKGTVALPVFAQRGDGPGRHRHPVLPSPIGLRRGDGDRRQRRQAGLGRTRCGRCRTGSWCAPATTNWAGQVPGAGAGGRLRHPGRARGPTASRRSRSRWG